MLPAALNELPTLFTVTVLTVIVAWIAFRIRDAMRSGTLTNSAEDGPSEEIDRQWEPDRFRLHLIVEIGFLVVIGAMLVSVLWSNR